jgi:hypothetical protein
MDLSNKLRDEEMQTNNVSNKLSNSNANKKNLEIENDTLNHDFNHKIKSFEEISREKVMALQKLNNVNNELERLNRDQL